MIQHDRESKKVFESHWELRSLHNQPLVLKAYSNMGAEISWPYTIIPVQIRVDRSDTSAGQATTSDPLAPFRI